MDASIGPSVPSDNAFLSQNQSRCEKLYRQALRDRNAQEGNPGPMYAHYKHSQALSANHSLYLLRTSSFFSLSSTLFNMSYFTLHLVLCDANSLVDFCVIYLVLNQNMFPEDSLCILLLRVPLGLQHSAVYRNIHYVFVEGGKTEWQEIENKNHKQKWKARWGRESRRLQSGLKGGRKNRRHSCVSLSLKHSDFSCVCVRVCVSTHTHAHIHSLDFYF